jgi:hypothetical protein
VSSLHRDSLLKEESLSIHKRMSFAAYKDLIEPGDTVILYISFNMMYPIVVTEKRPTRSGEMVENVHQTSYGALRVWDLVGKKFGTKVSLSRGYGYALYPTPELWTKTLPHRTQVTNDLLADELGPNLIAALDLVLDGHKYDSHST